MLKILIVDDNPLIRGGLGNMIEWEKLGAEPAGTAENGEEALLLCEKNQPDIVITDIRMPRKDGMELLSALQERYPGIQTIVVSAYDSFAYAKHAMTAGSINYILKPVDPVELNETISKAAKLIRGREGGTSLLLTDGLREALSGKKAAGQVYVLASAGADEETDGFCADIFGNCVQAEEGNVRYLAGIRKKEGDGLEFEKKYHRLLLRRCLGISEPLACRRGRWPRGWRKRFIERIYRNLHGRGRQKRQSRSARSSSFCSLTAATAEAPALWWRTA